MALCDAGDDEFDEELTEGYRGMADVEDLLWDDETDQGLLLHSTQFSLCMCLAKLVHFIKPALVSAWSAYLELHIG